MLTGREGWNGQGAGGGGEEEEEGPGGWEGWLQKKKKGKPNDLQRRYGRPFPWRRRRQRSACIVQSDSRGKLMQAYVSRCVQRSCSSADQRGGDVRSRFDASAGFPLGPPRRQVIRMRRRRSPTADVIFTACVFFFFFFYLNTPEGRKKELTSICCYGSLMNL